jgi:hypothetical protein
MRIEKLNTDCFCVSLDRAALRAVLKADPIAGDLGQLIEERCPNLFSAFPFFVSRDHVDAMAQVIRAIEGVVALPAYQASLAWMPDIARLDPGTRGVFMGYDFHIGVEGPRLIEINTNAGGALLNAILGRAQRACCEEVAGLVSGPLAASGLEQAFVDMFIAEWRAAGRAAMPRRIAIVDDNPEQQFLYPEFLLFARLFQRFGFDAAVLPPSALTFDGTELRDSRGRVDVVYNRLCDFSLAAPEHAALRAAYLARAAIVTPHPWAHALYADKRNLALLTDAERMRRWGVEPAVIDTLTNGIAHTRIVKPQIADELWAMRRKLFFKPAAGYGSKAAYRGDKLTRRVWEEIRNGEYVAQEFIAPGTRRVDTEQEMKVDVRNYVYSGDVQLLAARLYQGQTTNMRTAGGGFAPVFTTAQDQRLELRSAAVCESEPDGRTKSASIFFAER